MNRQLLAVLIATAACFSSEPSHAASTLDGTSMGWPWTLPFIGILLSIANGPLLFPKIWHSHYGKIALGWGILTVTPLAILYGVPAALSVFVHTTLVEYISFILLLFALYTVAGGILITGSIHASPLNNAGISALGTSVASLVGTTGAAMILIRPLIRANEGRKHNAHVVVFFIILVANIGGALTPLGDPPLFIGFLGGIEFLWTAQHLWLQTMTVAALVLAIFFALDLWHFRNEAVTRRTIPTEPLRLRGLINFLLLGIIVAAILTSAAWKPGIVFDVYGTKLELQKLLRDSILILVALASLWLTPDEHRVANGFSWEPIREVAILFAGIFVAIIPVMAMLRAGSDGNLRVLAAGCHHA
jgi:Na+/H+ antiporter NhaD/arsenite permease-like protein